MIVTFHHLILLVYQDIILEDFKGQSLQKKKKLSKLLSSLAVLMVKIVSSHPF